MDVLIKLVFITEADFQNWRFGKIPYLEKVCQANLHKLSAVNRLIRKYSAECNPEALWTEYNKWGKGPKKETHFQQIPRPQNREFVCNSFSEQKNESMN